MEAEVFAEWLRRQGHQVVRSKSSYWYDAGPRVYQAFPFGWIIQPDEQELYEFMRNQKAVALRYSTPVDYQEGVISYHVVLGKPYDLNLVDHRARNGIKTGLRSCQIEQISLKRLTEDGWLLQKDTLERQGRLDSMSQSEWIRICSSAESLAGFEAWGAIIEGELVASILTARIEDTWYVPYAQCLQKYMKLHINNALFYAASCDMLSRDGINEIFYSLHSLDAPESINEFKFRMGFKARPVRQRIVFNPWLRPFTNKINYRLLLNLTQHYPNSNLFSKAEGVLRFYIQGRQPLSDQNWPKCLADIKEQYTGLETSHTYATSLMGDLKKE